VNKKLRIIGVLFFVNAVLLVGMVISIILLKDAFYFLLCLGAFIGFFRMLKIKVENWNDK